MKNPYKIVKYKDKEYIVAETNKQIKFVFDREYLETLPNVLFVYNIWK